MKALVTLVVVLAALVIFTATAAASVPQNVSPRIVKMLPHIKERGKIARPVSEH